MSECRDDKQMRPECQREFDSLGRKQAEIHQVVVGNGRPKEGLAYRMSSVEDKLDGLDEKLDELNARAAHISRGLFGDGAENGLVGRVSRNGASLSAVWIVVGIGATAFTGLVLTLLKII